MSKAHLLPLSGRLHLSNKPTSLNYFKWDWKLKSLLSKYTNSVCHFDLLLHEISLLAAELKEIRSTNLLPTHSWLQVTPPTQDGGAQNPNTWAYGGNVDKSVFASDKRAFTLI